MPKWGNFKYLPKWGNFKYLPKWGNFKYCLFFQTKTLLKRFQEELVFEKQKHLQNVFAVFLFPNKTLASNNKCLFQTFCVALFCFVESELSSLQMILVPYKCVLQMTCSWLQSVQMTTHGFCKWLMFLQMVFANGY